MFRVDNAIRYAKSNMIFVMVFTLVNLALFFFNLNVSFPFSMFSPMYTGLWAYSYFLNGYTAQALVYVCLFILIMGSFLAIYLLTINRPKLLLVALILYVLDTAFMIYFYLDLGDFSWVIDALFHAWVIFSLAFGAYAAFKAKPKNDYDQTVQEILNNNERV